MLPIIFAAPIVASSNLGVYFGGAALLGVGTVLGYVLPKSQPKPPNPPTPNPPSSESRHHHAASQLQQTQRQTLKPALKNISEHAVQEIEMVLKNIRVRQRQWNSLIAAFEHETMHMKHTQDAITHAVQKLEATNQMASETATKLAQEINSIRMKTKNSSQDVEHAMDAMIKQSALLNVITIDLERIKQDLDCTQLQYRAQVTILSEAFAKANQQLVLRENQMQAQNAQIESLQKSNEQLILNVSKLIKKIEIQATVLTHQG